MSAQVDGLSAKYYVRRKVILGSGADGGVVRGIVKHTGEWHALKFLSSSAYSPQKEIEILRNINHANIVPILEIFAPIGPRQHWVFAMPEADFTLHEFLCRSRGPAASQGTRRNSDGVVRDLSAQMLAGIEHLHDADVVHRDIKPLNVLLSTVCDAGGPSCRLRLWLADFSRARHVPRVPRKRLRKKTQRDPPESEWQLTQNVCTVIYCAPEALFGEQDLEGMATYGLGVDVWSFGTILFEMLTLQQFCEGTTSQECLACLSCRLGPLVQNVGPCEVGWVDRRSRALPLSDYLDKYGWARNLLLGALQWASDQRHSAKELSILCQSSTVALAPAAAAAMPGHKAPAASQEVVPALLSPAESPRPTPSDVKCACSGHCYTSGHRWRGGCDCYNLIPGSKYCIDCCCEVVHCGRPRLRGALCSLHGRVLQELPRELVLARAARDAMVYMVPCDIEFYMKMSPEFAHDIGTLIIAGLMKEPTTIERWLQSGVPGKLHLEAIDSEALEESFLDLLQVTHDSPPVSEMQQLNQQGVARFLGSVTTCVNFGIIEKRDSGAMGDGKVPSRNAGDSKVFRLGLMQNEYVRSKERGRITAFLNSCRKHGNVWKNILQQSSINNVLQRVHLLLDAIADESEGAVKAGSREGYVRLHLVRKLFLTWLAYQPQPQRWGHVDIKVIQELSPDQKKYLDQFPEKWSVHDVSCLVFGRSDWGIFVSLFACLWHDVITRYVKDDADFEGLSNLLSTEPFRERARLSKEEAGHSICPANLVHDFFQAKLLDMSRGLKSAFTPGLHDP